MNEGSQTSHQPEVLKSDISSTDHVKAKHRHDHEVVNEIKPRKGEFQQKAI